MSYDKIDELTEALKQLTKSTKTMSNGTSTSSTSNLVYGLGDEKEYSPWSAWIKRFAFKPVTTYKGEWIWLRNYMIRYNSYNNGSNHMSYQFQYCSIKDYDEYQLSQLVK
jgi:hypothetical protein